MLSSIYGFDTKRFHPRPYKC